MCVTRASPFVLGVSHPPLCDQHKNKKHTLPPISMAVYGLVWCVCKCVCIYASKVDEWVLGVCLRCVTPLIEGSLLQEKAIKGVVGSECGCTHAGTLICFPIFLRANPISDGGGKKKKERVSLFIVTVPHLCLLWSWSRYQQQASWESLHDQFSAEHNLSRRAGTVFSCGALSQQWRLKLKLSVMANAAQPNDLQQQSYQSTSS